MLKGRNLARIRRRECRRSGKHKKGSTRSTWHGKRKCGDILTVAFDTFSDRHRLCRVIKRDSLRQLPPIPASASIYMTILPITSVDDELSYLLRPYRLHQSRLAPGSPDQRRRDPLPSPMTWGSRGRRSHSSFACHKQCVQDTPPRRVRQWSCET